MDDTGILALIEADPWMMAVMRTAARLDLPQWLIGGGVIRNKIWDHLHGVEREKVDTPDIDLIYFDPTDTNKDTEKSYDARLRDWCDVNWSAKNQARMHSVNGFAPFTSAEDGLAHWRITANSVALSLRDGELRLSAPYGTSDLTDLIVRSTPYFAAAQEELVELVRRKGWQLRWPKLRLATDSVG